MKVAGDKVTGLHHRLAQRPLVLSLLVILAIWASVGLLVWRERGDSLEASALLADSLTRSVAERIDGSLRGVDSLLQDVTAEVRVRQWRSDDTLAAFIRNRATAFAEVRNVFVTDADGVVKISSVASLLGADVSQRPWLSAARTVAARPQMVLSKPLFVPTTGQSGIMAIRPVVGTLGTFEGMVAVTLDPEFFRKVLRGVMSEHIDRSVIANLNGDVLARFPDPDSHLDLSIRSGPLFTEYLPHARSGVFIGQSGVDGLPRQASYVALEDFPLVVSVGATIAAALRHWSFDTILIAVSGLVFSALTLVVAIQLERRERGRAAAVTALAASEARYRILVENQTDLIHSYRPDTSLEFFNRAYADFRGLAPEALNGRKWLDFVPESERGFVLAKLRAMTVDSPSREDLRREIRADGMSRWIEWRTTAQFDARGQAVGYQTEGRDVTDAHLARQAIAEREELYSRTFHSNMAVKLLIDPGNGHIVDANRAAALFYGYPMDVLKRMHIRDISLAPPGQPWPDTAVAGYTEGRAPDARHRMASGAVRDVEVYSSQIHVGGRAYVSSIVVDVTERHRFAAELAAKSAELERSNAELEQFAYVASHDLRQPLRMISGFVTLLGRRLEGRLDQDEASFMGFVVAGVRRMDALILGLLEYSRVGRGGETAKPVSLTEAVAAAATLLGIGSGATDAALAVETPLPTVRGVQSELVRLFQNLLGNAIKYRHPDRPAHITVGCRRDGAEWRVWVGDNGIGIDAEHLERIFDIFQRLHGDTEYEGTGIGLSICRKIVQTHGGRIWAESEPGGGSRFIVALPAGGGDTL